MSKLIGNKVIGERLLGYLIIYKHEGSRIDHLLVIDDMSSNILDRKCVWV